MTENEARIALEGILDRTSVKAGDCIMLGIDMSKIPLPNYKAGFSREAFHEREQRWCQFVLDILLMRLTENGTLLFPTFSYSCTNPGSIYNAETTPSEVGPFTEFARSQIQAVRSLHPIFSVSGIGRDAKAILSNTGRAAFGALSPFSRFASNGVRFLCLGVELKNSITYIHHLEQSYGCPHRYNKSFIIKTDAYGMRVSGEWYAYLAYRGFGYSSDISILQNSLKSHGYLIESEWNGHPNHLAEVDNVDTVGYKLLSNDSTSFINRSINFRFEEIDKNKSELDNKIALVISAIDKI